jgi:hypothetical protein
MLGKPIIFSTICDFIPVLPRDFLHRNYGYGYPSTDIAKDWFGLEAPTPQLTCEGLLDPNSRMPDKDREPTVFIVSNRHPVTIRQSEDGEYDVAPSSGGLVGALHGLSQTTKFKWYNEEALDQLQIR